MNKRQAIEAIYAGKKLTHRLFTPKEWVRMEKDNLVSEDGYLLSFSEFWRLRTGDSWNEDWEIFKEDILSTAEDHHLWDRFDEKMAQEEERRTFDQLEGL